MEERRKQRYASFARSMGLLPSADYVRFLLSRSRSRLGNAKFSAEHPNVPVPPPDLMYEAFNHTCLEAYDRTGREHAAIVASLVRQYLDEAQLHGLEWGCGPGRVIRHLHSMVPNLAALTGADFNRRSIHWCQSHLGGSRFFVTDLRPPLPFDDASFDFVYALSVLTHLDEDGWASWLPELARVTKPEGLIVFTTHGEAFLPKLLPPERRAFESGHAVVRRHSREGKKLFATYHPGSFVSRTLPSTLSVLRHEASGGPWALQQDVWAVRKTSTTSCATPAIRSQGG